MKGVGVILGHFGVMFVSFGVILCPLGVLLGVFLCHFTTAKAIPGWVAPPSRQRLTVKRG